MTIQISGTTAAEIADSIRSLVEREILLPGELLPPVRELAAERGINRNTAVAAYRQLAQAGIVQSRGRGGTVITGSQRTPQEGRDPNTVLRDIGSGNPDPRLIPNPSSILEGIVARPILYGEPVIDPELEKCSHAWMSEDLSQEDLRITITSGAVDAIERLLAQALTRDDAVALEDPCFLSSIHTVRLGGYRPVPVPVDEEGMTVEGLRAALDAGVRAVICTPRAQNPTGASLSPRRAAQLRTLMAEHPFVLIIEDDHFSLLSPHPYHSLISATHQRYALIRSVSKFLGPDMCLAIAATDPVTAHRLAMRLSPGTTWVSHLLQRLTLAQLRDEKVRAQISSAGHHYAERNRAFVELLEARGVHARVADGLNIWVRLDTPARDVADRLMRRGWLARPGDEFRLETSPTASRHLRLTVHDLNEEDAMALADAIAQR